MQADSTAPTRYIAFLRAINVGGHTVKMTDLRRMFETLGFANVETFIASGNVVFDSPASDVPALERQIEAHLRQALGYEVATFLRSAAELAAVAQYEPPPPAAWADAGAGLYIMFLHAAPGAEARQKLSALCTPTDDFHLHDRELYWQRGGLLSESPVSGALLEKTLRIPGTIRNATTVRKMAAKYAAPSAG